LENVQHRDDVFVFDTGVPTQHEGKLSALRRLEIADQLFQLTELHSLFVHVDVAVLLYRDRRGVAFHLGLVRRRFRQLQFDALHHGGRRDDEDDQQHPG